MAAIEPAVTAVRPRQLPLDLGHVPGLSRDDLVVSPANLAAVALVERWPDWPAPVVVLAGPPGSGKSHLAAIWSEAAGAARIEAAALAAGVASVEGPVLVDDADLAGHAAENGLFHLLNAAREAGAHVLLTARRFPVAWGVRLPDLLSRLKAAATVEIGEPDDALLGGVLTKLFADRQVEVDQPTIQFLVRRIERSLATALDVVDRLDRHALATKSRITRQLAATVLSEGDAGQGSLDL
jgi:chromosomal replication initiation ATPase DnaA